MKRLETDGPPVQRSRSNIAISILAVLTALAIIVASGAAWYAWRQADEQVQAGQTTAEQVTRLCEGDPLFRQANPGLCGNAEEVVKDAPDIPNNEIDDPDPNDPDPNDPDPVDDLDPDNPEQQQAERDDAEPDDAEPDNLEIQDADPNDADPVDDPDPNDPDPDDPDPNDPDPDDPDPAGPGSWNCPDGQYVVGITRTEDGTLVLNCAPMNNGGGPPAS